LRVTIAFELKIFSFSDKKKVLDQGCTTFCYCRPHCFYLNEVRPPMSSSYIYEVLPVPTSVANCSCNEYTKSSLKIYQIHIGNKKLTIYCYFFNAFCLFHEDDQQLLLSSAIINTGAASSISTFLILALTDLVTTGKFNLPTPPTTFSFPLWCRTLLCSIIAGNFLFALLTEGIHSTSIILLYKRCNLCQSHFAKSSGTRTQFSHIWMHWLTKSPYLEEVQFFQNFSAVLQSRFPFTQNACSHPC